MKQEKNEELLTREAIEARYEKLTLKDDFMFGKVMQDEKNYAAMNLEIFVTILLPKMKRFY